MYEFRSVCMCVCMYDRCVCMHTKDCMYVNECMHA